MADEGAFVELILASERVGEWLDTLANETFTPLRRRRAADMLAKGISESEPTREEAARADAVSKLQQALLSEAGSSDAKLKASLEQCLAVCQKGPPKKMREYVFGGHAVTIKESALGEGVGALVWGAATIFCERLLELGPRLVQGQDVLELGAGCGMCGLLAARLGAERVVLTDCFGGVLRNLGECVALNSAAASTPCPCHVRYLDWSEEAAPGETSDGVAAVALAPGGVAPTVDASGGEVAGLPPRLEDGDTFPVVLTCDCLYEPQHAQQLADAHARRVAPGGCALLLLPIRDNLLMQTFLGAAHAHGFQTVVQQLDRAQWDRPGLRGTCDYEGGYNWVHLQWRAAPAATAFGLQDLPWSAA